MMRKNKYIGNTTTMAIVGWIVAIIGVIVLAVFTNIRGYGKEGMENTPPTDLYTLNMSNSTDVSYNTLSITDISMVDMSLPSSYLADVSGDVLTNPSPSFNNNDYYKEFNTRIDPVFFDTNNYNVQYHSVNENDGDRLGDRGTWVKKPDGNMEFIEWTNMPKYTTYYEPGAFPYGPSNYVPTYEDTVNMRYFSQPRGTATYIK
jgi:hypothetical protein